jgi:hypothetical protein
MSLKLNCPQACHPGLHVRLARAQDVQPSRTIEILNLTLGVSILLLSRHYQIALKIKPLYLTHNTCYMTSNTTRVVQQY